MNWIEVIEMVLAILSVVFVVVFIVAKVKKKDSLYENEPGQKNPIEGKKATFVEDESDKENADGKRGHLEVIGLAEFPNGVYTRYVKRGIDVILSFGGLVVLSPLFAIIAIAIKIDDPGPVLFTQKRVGENKRFFKLHKFRSMKMSTPHDKPTHMLENPEQYITMVGRFIRRHSLDELPQIWDIFIGNMSVIGPRPGLWNQDFLISERDKYGANDIKPGLTGWAQINGRDELEIEDKAKLDGEYAKNIGIKMDLKCFLGSIHVIGGDVSVVEGGITAVNERAKTKISVIASDNIELNEELKVSIIMPAYNAEQFISESVESVCNQSYKNWELIIIDDCSTDGTADIAQQYSEKDNRIVYLKNSSNLGVALTRNNGIDYATGDYIAFLDSDDVWLSEKLETQLKFMASYDYAFCFSSYQKFDSKSGRLGKVIEAPKMISAKEIIGNTIIGCLTVIYDTRKVGKVHMPNINHMEDNITWHLILNKGFIGYSVPKVLARYREGNASLTRNKKNAAKKQWKVYREYFGFSLVQSASYFLKYSFNAIKKHF